MHINELNEIRIKEFDKQEFYSYDEANTVILKFPLIELAVKPNLSLAAKGLLLEIIIRNTKIFKPYEFIRSSITHNELKCLFKELALNSYIEPVFYKSSNDITKKGWRLIKVID